jgi:hypothetical protein
MMSAAGANAAILQTMRRGVRVMMQGAQQALADVVADLRAVLGRLEAEMDGATQDAA